MCIDYLHCALSAYIMSTRINDCVSGLSRDKIEIHVHVKAINENKKNIGKEKIILYEP